MSENEVEVKFKEAIDEVIAQVEELLVEDHLEDLRSTYMRNPGKLLVGLIVRLSPAKKKGVIDVETRLSFVSERIKDSKKGTAGDPQQELPFETGKVAGDLQEGYEQQEQELEAQAEKKLPGEPAAIEPNEAGVFVVDPIFGYHGGTSKKPCEAFIYLVEYEGVWYQSVHHVLKGAREGGGYPILDGETYMTEELAFEAARTDLIEICHDLIQWFPTRKGEVKKMLAWADGLTTQDLETAMEQLAAKEASDAFTKSPLKDQIAFIAERLSAEIVDQSDAGEWFRQIIARTIEEHYPNYSYIDTECVLELLLDEELGRFNGSEDEDPDYARAIREAIATEEDCVAIVKHYIEEFELVPTGDAAA